MKIEPQPAWKTQRIELFLLEPEHVTPAYVDWLNDPGINRYLESRFVTHSLESTRQFVSGALASPNTLFLGFRSAELNFAHVGNIKIEINRHHGLGEVGIMIGVRDAHGRGIATAAIALIVELARDQLGLRKLTAGCYESNKGSERAFLKAGFELEGMRPAHFMIEGRVEALLLLGRLL
jgi:RimJ/RimL family protein N-acetyltransferase